MPEEKFKSAVGIEFTGDRVNLVKLAKTAQGIALVEAKSLKMPITQKEDGNKALVDNIIKAFEGVDFVKDGISFGVGGQISFVRKVKLPPVSHSKLKQIISFEVQQQVPFSLSEVIWDYQIISPISKIPGPIIVLMVAVKRSFVNDRLQLLQNSINKTPDVVDTSSLALHNCLVFNDLLPEKETGILINFGFSYTDVSIENNGEIAFTRAVPIGRKNILKKIAEIKGVEIEKANEILTEQAFMEDISPAILSVWEDLTAEIKRTTNYYLSQVEKATHFQYLYISGEFPKNSNLANLLKNSFGAEVKEIDPFHKIVGNFDGSTLQASNLCVSTGLALRMLEHFPVEVNLLLPQILIKKKLAKKRLPFIASLFVIVLIGCFTLLLGVRSYNLSKKKNEIVKPILKSYTPYISRIEELKRQRENLVAQLKDIESIIKQKFLLSKILLEISEFTPTDVYIVGISSQEAGTVSTGIDSSSALGASYGVNQQRSVPSLGSGEDFVPIMSGPSQGGSGEVVPIASGPSRGGSGDVVPIASGPSRGGSGDAPAGFSRRDSDMPGSSDGQMPLTAGGEIQTIFLNCITVSYPVVDEYIKQLRTSSLFKTVELVSVVPISQVGEAASITSETRARVIGRTSRGSNRGDTPATGAFSARELGEEQVQFMLAIELQKG